MNIIIRRELKIIDADSGRIVLDIAKLLLVTSVSQSR